MGFKVSKFMLNIFEYPLVDQRSRDFKNLLKKSTLLFVNHRFSIYFSPLRCEKNLNGWGRSVCQGSISVVVCSSAQRSGVYRELVEKDHGFVCYSPVLDTFFSAMLRKKLELTVPQCLSGIDFRSRQFECATQWSVSRTY